MSKIFSKTTIFICSVLAVIAMMWLPTRAEGPTAVHMSYFDVIPLNNAVKVEWATGSEAGTSGFMIKRSTAGGTEEFLDYVGDNGFIDAEGGVAMGSSYSATDNRVQNGNAYTYILIEVENSGNQIEQGRKTVTAGIPPTATPLAASGGGTGNSNATPTFTPRATVPATATATIQSGNVNPTATLATNGRPAIVTVTPRAPQATATQAVSNATTNDSGNQNTGTGLGVTEVLAQEETGSTETNSQTAPESAPILQDSYPGIEATAVPDSSQTYPTNSQPETSVNTEAYVGKATAAPMGEVGNAAVAASPVPVIGSDSGYTGTQPATDTTDGNASTSSNQSRIFLWLGFIVALLIFVTGLVGSILLFTRKSN